MTTVLELNNEVLLGDLEHPPERLTLDDTGKAVERSTGAQPPAGSFLRVGAVGDHLTSEQPDRRIAAPTVEIVDHSARHRARRAGDTADRESPSSARTPLPRSRYAAAAQPRSDRPQGASTARRVARPRAVEIASSGTWVSPVAA